MTNFLPDNASLENLKKQAKTLLKRIQDGDEEIIAQIRNSHPQFRERDPGLSEARRLPAACCETLRIQQLGRAKTLA